MRRTRALPELIWDGKYDEAGRRTPLYAPHPAPELHVAERYGLPPGKQLHSSWRNRLVAGENLIALHAMRRELRGQVQLVYIDPPFDVGSDFQLTLRSPGSTAAAQKRHAYRDKWGQGAQSYLQMMYERLVLLRDLLRDQGAIVLHCDWRSSAALRLMMDELFGRECFVNEIVWHYYNKYSGGKGCLPRAHDTLLLYGRSPRFRVNALRLLREAPVRQLVRTAVNGVLKNAKGPDGRVLYRTVTDKKADDVWVLPQLQPASPQWTGYGTQKHHDLLARVLEIASKPGDLVLDAFCGSGTTLTVAESLGRRWVGCDLGLSAVHITRRRLWGAHPDAGAAFDLCTLGNAERSILLEQFPRVERFIAEALAQLGAKPAAVLSAVDGTLGAARVTVVRTVEATGSEEIIAAAHAARASARRPLLYLAWDYAPGVWEALRAARLHAAVCPLLIPRDWLGPQGITRAEFSALPELKVTSAMSGRSVTVRLKDWNLPRLPAGLLRGSAELGGLEQIDAWAVHSGWKPGSAFAPQVIAYRDRRKPLPMQLTVPRPGAGTMLVKAWNAFGQEGVAVLRTAGRLRRRPSR